MRASTYEVLLQDPRKQLAVQPVKPVGAGGHTEAELQSATLVQSCWRCYQRLILRGVLQPHTTRSRTAADIITIQRFARRQLAVRDAQRARQLQEQAGVFGWTTLTSIPLSQQHSYLDFYESTAEAEQRKRGRENKVRPCFPLVSLPSPCSSCTDMPWLQKGLTTYPRGLHRCSGSRGARISAITPSTGRA